MISRKSVKNEAADQVANAVYRAADNIRQIVNDLCKTLAYSDITNYRDVKWHFKYAKIHSQKKLLIALILSLKIERMGKNFNHNYD